MRTNDRSFRKRAGIVAVMSALVVVGCSTGLRPFADGTAPPRPPTRPPVTAAPTPQITSSATDALPSSQPTIDADARTPRFAVFMKHFDASYAEFKSLGRKWLRELKQRDMRGAVEDLQPLRKWAGHEQSWLLANQPRSCYEQVHQAWSSYVDQSAEIFEILNLALDPIDEQEVSRVVGLMNDASAELKAYTESPAFRSGADFAC